MNSLWATFCEILIIGFMLCTAELVSDLIIKYFISPLIRRFKKEQQLDHEA